MLSLVETLGRFNLYSAHVILEADPRTNSLLWLGDFTAAIDKKWQEKNKIVAVLTVAHGLGISVDCYHKVIDAYDVEDYDISRDFDEGVSFIRQNLQHGSVLVHCAAGVSRSASMIICYLMRTQKWSLQKAYSYVKNKRSVIRPNDGFLECLRKEEIKLGLRRAPSSSSTSRDVNVQLTTFKKTFPTKHYYIRNSKPVRLIMKEQQLDNLKDKRKAATSNENTEVKKPPIKFQSREQLWKLSEKTTVLRSDLRNVIRGSSSSNRRTQE